MDIIEKIFDANSPLEELVIVELEPKNKDKLKKYYEDLNRTQRNITDVFGRNLEIKVYKPEEFSLEGNLNNSTILINHDKDILPNIASFGHSLILAKKLKEKYPNSNPKILVRGFDASVMQRVVYQVLEVLFNIEEKDKEFFENLKERTIVEHLSGTIGSITHRIGSENDALFKEWLGMKYQEDNHQSEIEGNYLVISTKAKTNGRYKVVSDNDINNRFDLSNYLAIFIDNNDPDSNTPRLGQGLHVLEKIVKLNNCVPIFYETAHCLEDFDFSDIRKINSFKNTIMISKNCAPKLSRSKEQAQKELKLGEILSFDNLLSKYCVEPVKIGAQGYIETKGLYLTFTKKAQKLLKNDDYKTQLFNEFNLDDNPVNHKLYVLALFHSRLKPYIHDPEIVKTTPDFFDFEYILNRLNDNPLNQRLLSLQNQYNEIVNKHTSLEQTIISHNDTKWDNWFNGNILGDFGSVSIGREYKDLARVLLNPDNFKSALDNNFIRSSINSYLKLRTKIDPEFKEDPKELLTRVKEMLFIESLRIAGYKSNNPCLVEGLMNVALEYI